MERRAQLNHVFEDAVKVVKSPVEFYRQMPKTGEFSDPIIFVLVMAVVTGLIIVLFSLLGAGAVGAMATGLGAIIIIPVFVLVGSFVSAAILFVVWKLMGSAENYATAYRCVAYATAIYPVLALLGLVPYLGTVAGIVWGIYLLITASMQVHQLDQKKSYTVFGILGVLLLVMNLSSEMAARKMAAQGEKYGEHFEDMGKQFEGMDKKLEGIDEMTPEEAGKALGDFLSGLEQSTREMREQAEEQAEEAQAGASGSAAASDMAAEK